MKIAVDKTLVQVFFLADENESEADVSLVKLDGGGRVRVHSRPPGSSQRSTWFVQLLQRTQLRKRNPTSTAAALNYPTDSLEGLDYDQSDRQPWKGTSLSNALYFI